MGIYSEYLEKLSSFESITKERKKQLKKIGSIRKRSVVTFAADMHNKGKGNDISISYADFIPFKDQVSNLKGENLDIIIETPGGFAEVVEDMVRYVRGKFKSVSFIIPGIAKSAGTIFAMSGDEILMGCTSALGPIDAQVGLPNGKKYSADAFLEGLENIKREVELSKKLNPSYIPILQNISPGEIQHCKNAQKFSYDLVTNWLNIYKFNDWSIHSSTGEQVTAEERLEQAQKIADVLTKQSKWKTHGRSIKLEDFNDIGLKINNYDDNEILSDAINRYYILLRLTFDKTGINKIFETKESQIYNSTNPSMAGGIPPLMKSMPKNTDNIVAEFNCNRCGILSKVQLNLKKDSKLNNGVVPYPKDNIYICQKCGLQQDISPMKLQIEAQIGREIVI